MCRGYSVLLLAYHNDSLGAMLEPHPAAGVAHSEQSHHHGAHRRRVRYADAGCEGRPFDLVSRSRNAALMLPGFVIQTETNRYYPASTAIAHLVVYVCECTYQSCCARVLRPAVHSRSSQVGLRARSTRNSPYGERRRAASSS